MQIIPSTSTSNLPENCAASLPYGIPFRRGNFGPIYIRVKPTGFLLNSNIVGDVLNRADILTVNLEKGTLYFMRGDTPVRQINAWLTTGPDSGETRK